MILWRDDDSVLIEVGPEFRIRSNRHSWTVEHKRSGKRKWEPVAHVPSLIDALNGLTDFHLRTCDAGNLADALNEVVKISEQIAASFAPMIALDLSRIHGIKRRQENGK
jgi:hypothetical protein